jgi:hypothetical protein
MISGREVVLLLLCDEKDQKCMHASKITWAYGCMHAWVYQIIYSGETWLLLILLLYEWQDEEPFHQDGHDYNAQRRQVMEEVRAEKHTLLF